MSDTPWLTIVGLGEDGPDGLPPASLAALKNAEIIMGAARHIALLPPLDAELVTWPVPYAKGVAQLMALRGRRVVALASGDPFWHGAGSTLTQELAPSEWRALPAAGSMSLAAARLGWPLERTRCFGLHAAPFAKLRSALYPGAQIFVTLRDGPAVAALAAWLEGAGFGATTVHILEALGGPRERCRRCTAADVPTDVQHPVVVGLEVAGDGLVMPLASGRPDGLFEHDGQITKRPVRALTLSALAPRPGEHLWDIGGGSGSIALEWLMSAPNMTADAIEMSAERAERITRNAARFGLPLTVTTGVAPEALEGLRLPDAVFIGGGISAEMLDYLWEALPQGTRLVANGVTLEAEALLTHWHAAKAGTLQRIEISESQPLGRKRGWKASYPIIQWSVTL
ncbi:precorrin-6y C5,15-methyltransferase (decarboxylating) subunit CbiE [Cognatishimia sp. SS12]|uniref:precorrin-6y C5,15-methyltransferase (decarboxylating) subunit CbiE n=1 Tax=Cognatishimia sp. SS12 TaxID=2979465 RepID=UPI00232AE08B|nr:precorrin-6y C5,15-methyltransferase (decarboxylating) subunit CbiE [Cognatishimia sp. SS12]MDC0736669.1 precorrin-6y C5,15-methyltransferase (decarboxylating) subunit CbiE [Cognatishimia sp. SS12]